MVHLVLQKKLLFNSFDTLYVYGYFVDMFSSTFTFSAKMWLWKGKGGWYFITLPKKIAKQIHSDYSEFKHSWGSLYVEATIGETTWKTSIFPNNAFESFTIPVKSIVRKKEGLFDGHEVTISLRMIL
jgi:hypothetical protein